MYRPQFIAIAFALALVQLASASPFSPSGNPSTFFDLLNWWKDIFWRNNSRYNSKVCWKIIDNQPERNRWPMDCRDAAGSNSLHHHPICSSAGSKDDLFASNGLIFKQKQIAFHFYINFDISFSFEKITDGQDESSILFPVPGSDSVAPFYSKSNSVIIQIDQDQLKQHPQQKLQLKIEKAVDCPPSLGGSSARLRQNRRRPVLLLRNFYWGTEFLVSNRVFYLSTFVCSSRRIGWTRGPFACPTGCISLPLRAEPRTRPFGTVG